MQSGSQKRRKRPERGVGIELPPGRFARIWPLLRRGDVLLRLAIAAAAIAAMCVVTRGWEPPFAWRTRSIPARDVTSRVEFAVIDEEATRKARDKARSEVLARYVNVPQPLEELQHALIDTVFQLISAPSYEQVDPAVWSKFFSSDPAKAATAEQRRVAYDQLRETLSEDPDLDLLKKAVATALSPFRGSGLVQSLAHDPDQGSHVEILVHPPGVIQDGKRVPVEEVRVPEVQKTLRDRLAAALQDQYMDAEQARQAAQRLYEYLSPRLPTTLTFDRDATLAAGEAAARKVEPRFITYMPGDKLKGVRGGEPLTPEARELLRKEHDAAVAAMSVEEQVLHLLADVGMYVALFVLCGFYILRRERRVIDDFRSFLVLMTVVVLTVGLMWVAANDRWRLELVPMLVFGMTLTIAYRQELSLLLAAAVALIAALTLGLGLAEFVILMAGAAASILTLQRVRSRTKLIYVGLWAAVVVVLTALGVNVVAGESPSMPLLWDALWFGLSAVLAGILLTGLLPFVESIFDVQTDLSLLELGDQSHQLLQELVRRAPGTYNHSINVASIAEAAAEAIGCNGLLVRVGAYFHDIGKMLKPAYFVENQSMLGGNRHESLVPAMSTLVIIAHVKDGAEMGRQHHLPQPIIDFIEQHHGTTLVEYFYRQASRQSEENPDSGEVDESNFRYPGPKPQTKEAAVMMIADAVESASRALSDPLPARIESLVEELAMKRLLDGQFDESGITLQELRIVENSLIKSLTAVYHGRVKYPDQQTA
ncbi:MAG: HDIG domain-containing protein [Planctomycetes bacterium]|nr:HDIG domain-containing protein [Planctomycetota bacterium]